LHIALHRRPSCLSQTESSADEVDFSELGTPSASFRVMVAALSGAPFREVAPISTTRLSRAFGSYKASLNEQQGLACTCAKVAAPKAIGFECKLDSEKSDRVHLSLLRYWISEVSLIEHSPVGLTFIRFIKPMRILAIS
jgi:hypothetical protein